jgi:hypothetical protein
MSYHRAGSGLGFFGPSQPWSAATAGKWISETTRPCPAGTHETKVTVAQQEPTRGLIGHPTSTGTINRKDCFPTGRVKEAAKVGRTRYQEWCGPKPARGYCNADEVEVKDPWFGRDKIPECRPSGHSYTLGGRTNAVLCCPKPESWDKRTLTHEEYNNLDAEHCPGTYRDKPDVPLIPQWAHAYGHIGSTRTVTDVREGPHLLICKPEFGQVRFVVGDMTATAATGSIAETMAAAATAATEAAAEEEEAIVEEITSGPPEQAGAPGMPGWVLPVGIGAGVLAIGGIAFLMMRSR